MAQPSEILKDAAYVTIGFGVIAFQKAQVRRQELRKQLETQLAEARDGLAQLADGAEDRVKLLEERMEALQHTVEQRIDDVEDQLERLLDDVEGRLTGQAQELFRTARASAKDARGQLRHLVKVSNGSKSAA